MPSPDGLIIEDVPVENWRVKKIRMREISMADYLAVEDSPSEMRRQVALLGRTVLDEKGDGVGDEAILSMPPRVFRVLVEVMNKFVRAALRDSEDEGKPLAPLAPVNGSGIASPSH
jgi:hypothetical protein